MTDVSDAILYALDETGMPVSGAVLLVMPDDFALSARFPAAVVWHPWCDQADLWRGRGHVVIREFSDLTQKVQAVILCAPRQKEETLYLMAKGLELLDSGGTLVCAASNQSGGQALPKLFEALGLESHSVSKHKCRVVWYDRPQDMKPDLLEKAVRGGDEQERGDGLISRPGLFSWNRVDRGTDILMHQLPFSLSGIGADFGCGIGVLGRKVLQRYSSVQRFFSIDNDARAVACARRNLEQWQMKCDFIWADVRRLPVLPPLDFIVMNPPFHQGRADVNLLGQNFISSGAAHLAPGGMLVFVANVHLPYEALLHQVLPMHRLVKEQDGYKIIEAVK